MSDQDQLEIGMPVVVTTSHRGVFFGLLADQQTRAWTGVVTLTAAQMCVEWSADVQGVLGLAATGPSAGCKVTRPVPLLTVSDVTAVATTTAEAAAAWTARPWR
jgi:hypothetical protein